jgi:hypothetical protein
LLGSDRVAEPGRQILGSKTAEKPSLLGASLGFPIRLEAIIPVISAVYEVKWHAS